MIDDTLHPLPDYIITTDIDYVTFLPHDTSLSSKLNFLSATVSWCSYFGSIQ
jgi:hypothetical protein